MATCLASRTGLAGPLTWTLFPKRGAKSGRRPHTSRAAGCAAQAGRKSCVAESNGGPDLSIDTWVRGLCRALSGLSFFAVMILFHLWNLPGMSWQHLNQPQAG